MVGIPCAPQPSNAGSLSIWVFVGFWGLGWTKVVTVKAIRLVWHGLEWLEPAKTHASPCVSPLRIFFKNSNAPKETMTKPHNKTSPGTTASTWRAQQNSVPVPVRLSQRSPLRWRLPHRRRPRRPLDVGRTQPASAVDWSHRLTWVCLKIVYPYT